MHNSDITLLREVPASDTDDWVTTAELAEVLDRSQQSVTDSMTRLWRKRHVERQKRSTSGQPYEYRRTEQAETELGEVSTS